MSHVPGFHNMISSRTQWVIPMSHFNVTNSMSHLKVTNSMSRVAGFHTMMTSQLKLFTNRKIVDALNSSREAGASEQVYTHVRTHTHTHTHIYIYIYIYIQIYIYMC